VFDEAGPGGDLSIRYELTADREEKDMLRKLLLIIATASVLVIVFVGMAYAASNPAGHGQPGQTCGSNSAPNTPGGGNSSGSPGSPFTGGTADGKYNAAESQYDVACYQVSQPHP
jgi:hypothetical protein